MSAIFPLESLPARSIMHAVPRAMLRAMRPDSLPSSVRATRTAGKERRKKALAKGHAAGKGGRKGEGGTTEEGGE